MNEKTLTLWYSIVKFPLAPGIEIIYEALWGWRPLLVAGKPIWPHQPWGRKLKAPFPGLVSYICSSKDKTQSSPNPLYRPGTADEHVAHLGLFFCHSKPKRLVLLCSFSLKERGKLSDLPKVTQLGLLFLGSSALTIGLYCCLYAMS